MNPRIPMSVPSSNESKLKEEGTNDIHPPSVSNNDLSGEHKFGRCHHSLTQNGHVRWHTKYQDPPYPPKGHVPCYFNIACFIQQKIQLPHPIHNKSPTSNAYHINNLNISQTFRQLHTSLWILLCQNHSHICLLLDETWRSYRCTRQWQGDSGDSARLWQSTVNRQEVRRSHGQSSWKFGRPNPEIFVEFILAFFLGGCYWHNIKLMSWKMGSDSVSSLKIWTEKPMARDIFPKLFTEFPHLTNPQQLKQVLQRPVVGWKLVGLMHLDFAHIHCHPLKFLVQKIENKGGKFGISLKNFFQKSQQTKLHKIHCVVGFLVSLSKSSHCEVCCQAFQIQHSATSLRLQGVLTWLIPVSGFSLGRTAWNMFFGEVALVDEWWRHLKSFYSKKNLEFFCNFAGELS